MSMIPQEQRQDVAILSGEVSSSAPLPVTLIKPVRGWVPLNLRELVEYGELLYFFVWRDIKVRYKQTVLGAAWAIIQPLFSMIVFTVFFGRLAKMPSDGIPYPLFAYAGLVPWMYFANALTQSSNSLVEHERLITKVYFPRLLVPLASVLAGLVDFAISFALLLVLLVFFGVMPGFGVLLVPLFVLLAALTAFGVGLWLSALNVQYRDVRYVIPFLTQFWLFATPVAYPASLVPAQWRPLYGLNPMVGVVEGLRWALFGGNAAVGPMLLVSAVTVVVVLVSGLYYFRRMEQGFADVV